MKPDPDRERLLDDVLDEAAPPGFKESLLQHTLQHVRRRNRVRRLNRALLAIAVVATVPLLLWKFSFPPPPPRTTVKEPPFGIVTSQPMPREMIVETRPGSIAVITSSAAAVAYVETGEVKDLFKEITDEQLLSLMAGHPVALVRSGPNQAELIFLNPEDQEGFPIP